MKHAQLIYQSTKQFGPISTGHRQWRDKGFCSRIHGYGRHIEITFGASKLDDKGWVVDFGGLKQVKSFLEDSWDHRTLIASDDPLLEQFKDLERSGGISINVMDISKGYGPGIEQSCKYVFDMVEPLISLQTNGRCWVESVRVWEHENNSAIYKRV